MKPTLLYMSVLFVFPFLCGMEIDNERNVRWLMQRAVTSDPREAEVEAFRAGLDLAEMKARKEIAYFTRKNEIIASVNIIFEALIAKDIWYPGEIEQLFSTLWVPVYPEQTTEEAIKIFFGKDAFQNAID